MVLINSCYDLVSDYRVGILIMNNQNTLSNNDLLEIGFKSLSHFTVGQQSKYLLSRRRYLSAMCVGTPNETIWLGVKDKNSEITDMVCVHNADYDGYITAEKLKELIKWFGC